MDMARKEKSDKPDDPSRGEAAAPEQADQAEAGYVQARFGSVPVLITRTLAARIAAFMERCS